MLLRYIPLTCLKRIRYSSGKCHIYIMCYSILFTILHTILHSVPVLAPVPDPVPYEPTKVNKDVIYGSVIGVLALICVVFIIFIAWKRRKRK